MTELHATLLGIVEGLTEFLPISSTAHLVLASRLLQVPQTEFLKTFEIAIQLGAILAVVFFSWQSLFVNTNVITKVLAAFFPTAIIGFLLHDLVKKILLESIPVVLWALAIGGVLMIIFDLLHTKIEKDAPVSSITYTQALLIGVFQSFAIIPGVSRAAATIIGGQLLGLPRSTTVEFSFLLAVPTIAAAATLDILKSSSSMTSANLIPLLIGFLMSFLVAYMSIRWFLTFIKTHSFIPFGIYRIGLAVACAILLLR